MSAEAPRNLYRLTSGGRLSVELTPRQPMEKVPPGGLLVIEERFNIPDELKRDFYEKDLGHDFVVISGGEYIPQSDNVFGFDPGWTMETYLNPNEFTQAATQSAAAIDYASRSAFSLGIPLIRFYFIINNDGKKELIRKANPFLVPWKQRKLEKKGFIYVEPGSANVSQT